MIEPGKENTINIPCEIQNSSVMCRNQQVVDIVHLYTAKVHLLITFRSSAWNAEMNERPVVKSRFPTDRKLYIQDYNNTNQVCK